MPKASPCHRYWVAARGSIRNSTDEATAAFRRAGFEVCEVLERAPYPEVEYQGRRVYLLARKPESA
jgi:hypothetical protein